MIGVRPSLNVTKLGGGCGRCVVSLYYDPEDVFNAWKLFIDSIGDFGDLETFQIDLIEVTRQVMGDIAFVLYHDIVNAFHRFFHAFIKN